MAPIGQKYKVKLVSGRVLGPLDLERIRLLIRKNQIVGTEMARLHPQGEWQDINRISEIAALLIRNAQGMPDSTHEPEPSVGSGAPSNSPTVVLPGATLPEGIPLPELKTLSKAGGDATSARALVPELDELAGEKTVVAPKAPPSDLPSLSSTTKDLSLVHTDYSEYREDEDRTEMATPKKAEEVESAPVPLAESTHHALQEFKPANISAERTVVLQRSSRPDAGPGTLVPRRRLPKPIRVAVIAVLAALVTYEFIMLDTKPREEVVTIRPKLPVAAPKADPQKSETAYREAMPSYLEDTVAGYRDAVSKLSVSVSYQPENVKALAILASSYLNLIDSSEKDENYFNVIYNLIELSRSRGLDLPETVISDVEFFLTVNKPEVAQDRIVNYTRTHQNFGLELFYYLGLAFFQRGDSQTAARYISQVPDQKVFSPKVFFLRGQIAEKLGEPKQAKAEYEKAIALNPKHAKSRLAIARLDNSSGEIQLSGDHLEFLVKNKGLLSPRDLAQAYYLHSLYSQLFKRWDVALGSAERAVKFDRENHDYILEFYSLRAKAGDKIQALRKEARMYFYLGEGQRLISEGKYEAALSSFLLARHENEKSIAPLLAMGDMFRKQNDLMNARTYYGKAAALAPKDIDVWSKYIEVLIQSYEWEEAQAAMDKFRKLPVPQSAIDKAAADIVAKQGNYEIALGLYRKAMTRDRIDPGVYLAYADALMATNTKQGYEQAPFFYALALRFDPLNFKALIGTAKCIAATESIDRAITMLRDELQKSSIAHPQLLAAIAEFQIQKGDWEQAQQNVSQAVAVNPEYAYSWLLQARIHLNREGQDKTAVAQALEAFKAYSDRNGADPTGYLERYRIFMQKADFESAGAELERIETVYPKYPNLRYYKGARYAVMKNHKQAILEFQAELKNNPGSTLTWLSLGKELIENGEPQAAIDALSKAMQLSPRAAEPKQVAGYANYLLKNYAGAIALYRASIGIDPANPSVHKRLGMAYEAAGDMSNAAASYRKYIQMEPDAPDREMYERYR